jgi:hypothetical protein
VSELKQRVGELQAAWSHLRQACPLRKASEDGDECGYVQPPFDGLCCIDECPYVLGLEEPEA